MFTAVAGGIFSVGGLHAQTLETTGQLRGTWAARQAAGSGPLAQAHALVPGVAAVQPSAATVQAELRSAARLGGVAVNTRISLQHQHPEGGPGQSDAWVNEATLSGSVSPGLLDGWSWSAGKQVVSWDVGYAFRPNDVVQQETRRTLSPTTLEGRPLLVAEHFSADSAWSLVWVNPTRDRNATGADEPALAARMYRRDGAVDWHGFARHGTRTGASLGAAASWVASDALELHASLRHYQRHDTLLPSAAAAGTALAQLNPWQTGLGGSGQQALVGGTWTNESQVSLLLEAWHDGTGPSASQWRQWTARNQALPSWATRGAPASAVAGNLAWQASAFNASPSLHRRSLYARLSWTHEAWQPALDVLYHPADRGHMLTASLSWQGDRVKLEGGLRTHGGPASAVLRQLPVQKQGYLTGTWAF
ncbi:MAG: hypothetical protein RLZZ352_2340 [Pseudomonadota bacterium]